MLKKHKEDRELKESKGKYRCRVNQFVFDHTRKKSSFGKKEEQETIDEFWKNVNESMILASRQEEEMSKDLREFVENFKTEWPASVFTHFFIFVLIILKRIVSSSSESILYFSSFSFPFRLKRPIDSRLNSNHIASLMWFFSNSNFLFLTVGSRSAIIQLILIFWVSWVRWRFEIFGSGLVHWLIHWFILSWHVNYFFSRFVSEILGIVRCSISFKRFIFVFSTHLGIRFPFLVNPDTVIS